MPGETMCGIFGCISDDAAMSVLEGLRKLEYRGYDSAGLAAIFDLKNGQIETERTTGYVSDLVSKANGRFKDAKISIGHTRWATHGGVTDSNAHPHSSNDGMITIVHNGIIENASSLLSKVEEMGYSVESETDSELFVHLFHNEIHSRPTKNLLSAFNRTIDQLEGSWAIAAIIVDHDAILVARNGAPLVIGRGSESIVISSDIQPLYGSCSEVAFMNDGDVFSVTRKGVSSIDGSVAPKFEELEGTVESEDKGMFPHLMLKEINDQPVSLSNVLGGRIGPGGNSAGLNGFSLKSEEIRKLDRINLVACGTAFFAAQIGIEYLRDHTNMNVEAFQASEFPAEHVCGSNTLTIGISQSGETKDTLDALQKAKMTGGYIASICNVIGSTISRFTGNGAYLHAGPEYSVASTKAFTNMVAALLLFALRISDWENTSKMRGIIQQLRELPNRVSAQLRDDDGSLEKATSILSNAPSAIFIGRGLSAPLVKEGALKMMEIAYLPCLAYPGGELKHGPIALIEEGTPVIAIAPSDETLPLMEASIRECKSRGAKVIMITDTEGPITKFADVTVNSQFSGRETSPIINAIPLQLLAYRLAVRKDRNVDRPRNLAKSVTVI